MDSPNLVIEPTTERSQQPYWPGTWVTIVELEFQHIIIDSNAVGDVSRLGPSPDQLHEGLNTSVTVVTSNGVPSVDAGGLRRTWGLVHRSAGIHSARRQGEFGIV